jgi:hypothetical protein
VKVAKEALPGGNYRGSGIYETLVIMPKLKKKFGFILQLVWAEISIISWAVSFQSMRKANSKVENSAQVLSCHGLFTRPITVPDFAVS